MTITGVATRYAHALVEALANCSAGTDPRQALSGLIEFVETLEGSHDLNIVLLSPAVNPQRKKAVIRHIAGAMELDSLIRNLLLVLVDHRRMGIIREITDEAAVLLDEQLGFVRADVSSAAPLSGEQEQQIAAGLETLTGKRVRMEMTLDPELIGGVMARVGSIVYDGSIRGRLQALGERLGVER